MPGWRSLPAIRTMVRGYIGFAMIACAVVAPAGLAYITHDLAERQNEIANAGKRRQMEALLAFVEDQFQQHTFDETQWDEPYLRLVHELDEAWFHVNIGANLYGAVLHQASAVVDEAGSTLVGAWHDQPESWDPRTRIGAPFEKLFARLRTDPESINSAAGFAVVEGRIALIAVGPITPIVEAAITRRRYAVFVREITDKILDDYRALTGQHDLQLRLASNDDQHSVPIADPGGVALGELSWTALTPGTAAWRAALPKIAASTALLLGLVMFALYRAQLSQHALAASEARASHLAYHDPLTRLANRRSLQAAIERTLALPARHQLLLIDLDGFKEVNDSLGHPMGDLVLAEIARRLAARVGGWGTVGRLGGDEFAVLLAGDTSVAERLARTLLELVEAPVEIPLQAVSVSATIGVASTDGVDTVSELLRRADVALYEAKGAGKRRVAVYHPELDHDRAARPVHPGGRGDAADQPARRLRAARGVPRGARPRGPPGRRQPLPDPAPRRAAGRRDPGHPRRDRPAADAARGRDHRGLPDPAAGPRGGGAAPAARTRHQGQPRRVRRGLCQPRLSPPLPLGQDQARPLVHPVDRGRCAGAADHQRGRRAWPCARHPVTAEGVETEEQARQVRAAGCELQQGFLYSRPMFADELAAFVGAGRPAGLPAPRLGVIPVDA